MSDVRLSESYEYLLKLSYIIRLGKINYMYIIRII